VSRPGVSRLTLAQQELQFFTEKMNRQNQQITDYEYEITLLRKQIEGLETEHEKDTKKIQELEELLAKCREVPCRLYTHILIFISPICSKLRRKEK